MENQETSFVHLLNGKGCQPLVIFGNAQPSQVNSSNGLYNENESNGENGSYIPNGLHTATPVFEDFGCSEAVQTFPEVQERGIYDNSLDFDTLTNLLGMDNTQLENPFSNIAISPIPEEFLNVEFKSAMDLLEPHQPVTLPIVEDVKKDAPAQNAVANIDEEYFNPMNNPFTTPTTIQPVTSTVVNLEDNVVQPKSNSRKIIVRSQTKRKSKKDIYAHQQRHKLGIDERLVTIRPRLMKREKHIVPDLEKDATYYEKRKKNSEAAKRCRERKRQLDEARVAEIRSLAERAYKLEKREKFLEARWKEHQLLKKEATRLKYILDRFFITGCKCSAANKGGMMIKPDLTQGIQKESK